MASLLPGGFQLPFQRRLSRLYNDTKKSSDFVKEPFQNEQDDPEAKALHRKLRIQKDRLVSWGLEWSDPSNQAAEIDESLSKAGLSEVVGSIMSTIKDILAEAEPLWLSSKRVVEGTKASPDSKPPLIQWDKNRFEDLVNDLTASIDTLYDLSRTRASGLMPRRASKAPFKGAGAGAEDYRAFESTRMQTPQQIDPGTLTKLKSADGNPSPLRQVVFMSKTAYSELAHGRTREPWGPLLLEYATFDSIYSTTGIMPPMARFEKLCAGLQQNSQRAPGAWIGLPRLLGYFEDIENSRIGLVYRFPSSFNAVSIERLTQNAMFHLPTLHELLSKSDSEPHLEAKFRLAYNLTNTVFDMHARGVTHGHLFDKNISFSKIVKEETIDVRRPLISSFDLFPDENAAHTVWTHPLAASSRSTDARVLELYPLAMLLLSVGLWIQPESIASGESPETVQEKALKRLAVRCGSLYMKAVQACWEATSATSSGHGSDDALLSEVQVKVSRFLEACCILDGVSGLEHRLHDDLEQQNEDAEVAEPSNSKTQLETRYTPAQHPRHEVDRDIDIEPVAEPTMRPEGGKLRLYPNVQLAPEAVEKWNSILMPQINQALRSFYRKHPESVEISLESVGPDAQSTQPTVLVVCTSVGKVRAILKKRLGDIFDGSTGFALKVCRGQVVRSRKLARSVYRSMTNANDSAGKQPLSDDDDEIEAVNPEFQERPFNGASIGAWIGDRHLPPVSFGGLVVIDDKTYGMTVHHMLDDPDRDFTQKDARRSAALPSGLPSLDYYDETEAEESTYDEEDYGFELSDSESEAYSETDITSEYGDDDDYDEEEEEYQEPGDIPGIEPGCGEGYIVTQPALDDVEDGFYPCEETEDEDHLDTYSLGEVYASSGIRRKQANGLLHEVDWALFQFDDGRAPEENSVFKAEDGVTRRGVGNTGLEPIKPTTVASSASLPGMQVQCVARTSGVQTGQILPALCSVKICGRTSPSQMYQVTSATEAAANNDEKPKSKVAMGIPGDSGAWVIERQNGQLCGHVLAWSQRKRVAYICPMDVLLMDIVETLEAMEVKLPGGEALVTSDRYTVTKQLEKLNVSELPVASTDTSLPGPVSRSSLLASLRIDRLKMDGMVSA